MQDERLTLRELYIQVLKESGRDYYGDEDEESYDDDDGCTCD